MTSIALSIEDLEVTFPNSDGFVPVVSGVSLSVEVGQTLGLVGESGSGKSLTLRAMCGLVPNPGRVSASMVRVDGQPCESPEEFAAVRGTSLTMIFQDPDASLNPVRSIGSQIAEVLRVKCGESRRQARESAIELLDRVGIAEPARRFDAYPHQLSGGMRQRVMIALAVAPRPKVILADEPTTALDVITQQQILELLLELQRDAGMAIVLVTHDLGVVAEVCDEMAALYAGCVVERGAVEGVLRNARHPYTRALISAVPTLSRGTMPAPINGQPPLHAPVGVGCPFEPRCGIARKECTSVNMREEQASCCACPFERER